VTGYAEVYFVARYQGFDLEEPEWDAFRQDVAATQSLLTRVKASGSCTRQNTGDN